MLELWSLRTLKGGLSKFKTGTVGKRQVAGIEGRTSADIKKTQETFILVRVQGYQRCVMEWLTVFQQKC